MIFNIRTDVTFEIIKTLLIKIPL